MDKLLKAKTSRELAQLLGVKHKYVVDFYNALENEIKIGRRLYLPTETHDDEGVYLKNMTPMFIALATDSFIKSEMVDVFLIY